MILSYVEQHKKDKTIERRMKSAKKDLGIARNQSEPRDPARKSKF